MAKCENYILAGGGTGGHLYPAVAIAQRLREQNPACEIRFVGTRRGLENRVVPQLGFPLLRIAVRGFARRLTPANLLAPFVAVWGFFQCVFILLKFRPNAVIGTGGYVSGPVLFAAALLRFPTLIQEQNSYPGVTTRLLAHLVRRVHISFAESRVYFKNQDKLVLSGNPVRSFKSNKSKAEASAVFGLKADKPILLVFGGSQGAQALNKTLLETLQTLLATDLQIIWSTGRYDIEKVRAAVASYQERVWVSDYIADIESAYFAADLALTRAGALTLAELTLAGLPSILVPLPSAAANHQVTNARVLQENGAAIMIYQHELNREKLTGTIINLLTHKTLRDDMARAARAAAFPNATQEIVESILSIEKKRGSSYATEN